MVIYVHAKQAYIESALENEKRERKIAKLLGFQFWNHSSWTNWTAFFRFIYLYTFRKLDGLQEFHSKSAHFWIELQISREMGA